MSGRMDGKVVLVTGAAHGIGRGCAELLAREGARVVIGDIDVVAGEAVAAALRQEGLEARFSAVDVQSETQCETLIASAVTAFGRLDGLLNNVGWFPRASLEETTTELWERVLNVNLRSAFYCCKYAVPRMRAAGGGSIVNIGSLNGLQALPNLVAYGAAKGGLLALTRTLAGAYAQDRIRVNYVIPGWVLTDTEIALHASFGSTEAQLRQAGAQLPLGRQQTPQDTAYAVVYLLSDESVQVTGMVMSIDAGASTLPVPPRGPYPG